MHCSILCLKLFYVLIRKNYKISHIEFRPTLRRRHNDDYFKYIPGKTETKNLEICLAVTSSEYSLLLIKTKLQITTSLLSTNYEKGVVTNYDSFKNYTLRTGRRPRGCGVMIGWVDNKRVDIN